MNKFKKSFGSLSAALFCVIVLVATMFFVSCVEDNADINEPLYTVRIAVFVPGVVKGSAVYEMLVSGVTRAVNEYRQNGMVIGCDVIEAGTDQAQWSRLLTALTVDGTYDVIISSNPSLPEIIEPLTSLFPNQKYILLDALVEGNMSIAAVQYNQKEEAYLIGYMAGLVTTSSMPYANAAKKIGLLAAQEYPVMNNTLLPYFIKGAQAVDPAIEVDFRVVGNWYDASKSAELARAMYQSGVDVILPISGGANQGVIATAKELGFYIVWFDDNGFAKAPNYVVASAIIDQDKMAYQMTKSFIDETVQWGKTITVSVSDGFIDFISDDPLYLQVVPQEIQEKMATLFNDIRDGRLVL